MTLAGEKLRRAPAGRQDSHMLRNLIIAIVFVIVVVGWFYASSNGFHLTIAGGVGTQNGQSSQTSVTTPAAKPVSVVTIFETYANNQATGDLRYTGKMIYVIAASGTVTNQNGNYVSYCPSGFTIQTESNGAEYAVNDFCYGISPDQIILTWQNETVASIVPTDGSTFAAECTVNGLDTTTHLFPILTFNNCVPMLNVPA
jgi:tRNA_anti-like